jgi:hypothetical protein
VRRSRVRFRKPTKRKETKRLCQQSHQNQKKTNPLLSEMETLQKQRLSNRRVTIQKTPETLDEKICPLARISESVSNRVDPSPVRPALRRPFDRRAARSSRPLVANNFTSFVSLVLVRFAIVARTTSYGQPRQPRPIVSSPWWTPPIGSS